MVHLYYCLATKTPEESLDMESAIMQEKHDWREGRAFKNAAPVFVLLLACGTSINRM